MANLAIFCVALLVVAFLSKALVRDSQRELDSACLENLKSISAAVSMYQCDWAGKYPSDLSRVVPKYLAGIPNCPAAGRDTYSATYKVDGLEGNEYPTNSSMDPPDKAIVFRLNCDSGLHLLEMHWVGY